MRFMPLGILLFVAGATTMSSSATTYYVSVSGKDTNAGTSTSAPWQTVGQVNSFLSGATINPTSSTPATLRPGDSVLFRGGDVFRVTLQCGSNTQTAGATTTLANTPPRCSGNSSGQTTLGSYGTGYPVFDGADPYAPTWTLVTGATYSAPVPATGVPAKLFVDGATTDTPQLLPVPNSVGAYSSATTYKFLDMVTTGGNTYIHGKSLYGEVAPGGTVNPTWVQIHNGSPNNTTQQFSSTNSGLANVEATPGSWYTDGTTIYVHLQGDSAPNSHTFEVTNRAFGLLLSSANYVTVEGLAFEHQQKAGILAVAYATSTAGGNYDTNEYNQILSNKVWNTGDLVNDAFPLQDRVNHWEGGIILRADGGNNPHLLRGDYVAGNIIGTVDAYFGTPGLTYTVGIAASGIDGAGTTNNKVIAQNYIKTHNGHGLIYNTGDLNIASGTTYLNNGGRVYGNELTDNQGNIYFSATQGGRNDHNYIHESYGEGVQSGGNSVSTATVPQTEDHNLIVHLGVNAALGLFNGFDCNGGAPGIYFNHNTVFDTNSASITLEGACGGSTVTNNIFDQDTKAFPAYSTINPSFSLYFLEESHTSGTVASNNYWAPGSSPHPFHDGTANTGMVCTDYLTSWPDTSSLCGTDAQLMFTNDTPGVNDFSLQSTSPAVGKGTGGSNMGAYDGTGDAYNGVTTVLN